jgi:hypothetical protein
VHTVTTELKGVMPLTDIIIILPRLILTPFSDNKFRKGIDIRLQKFTIFGKPNMYYDNPLSRQQIREY